VTNLQVDFDNLNARYEEESEAAASLRSQLQKAITDYVQLKSRYDKDVISKQEELEDLRLAETMLLPLWLVSPSTLFIITGAIDVATIAREPVL